MADLNESIFYPDDLNMTKAVDIWTKCRIKSIENAETPIILSHFANLLQRHLKSGVQDGLPQNCAELLRRYFFG